MGKKKTTAPAPETVNVAPPQAKTDAELSAAAAGIAVEDIFPEGADAGELVMVVPASGLNLREGPGVNFPVVEVLPEAAVLAVQPLPCGAEVIGWALVHTGARTGWVDSRYIQALMPAEG